MFFTPKPADWFPGTQIDIVQFPQGAGGDTLVERSFTGPLDVMLRDALAFCQNNLLAEYVRKRPDQAEAERYWNRSYAVFFEPLGDGGPRHAENTLGRPQAQPLGGHGTEHFFFALRVRLPALGSQYLAYPARPAAKLLVAAGVPAVFDEVLAAARRAAWRGFRRQDEVRAITQHRR